MGFFKAKNHVINIGQVSYAERQVSGTSVSGVVAGASASVETTQASITFSFISGGWIVVQCRDEAEADAMLDNFHSATMGLLRESEMVYD
jgi:hypothetical protein